MERNMERGERNRETGETHVKESEVVGSTRRGRAIPVTEQTSLTVCP